MESKERQVPDFGELGPVKMAAQNLIDAFCDGLPAAKR